MFVITLLTYCDLSNSSLFLHGGLDLITFYMRAVFKEYIPCLCSDEGKGWVGNVLSTYWFERHGIPMVSWPSVIIHIMM